jgi:hypothetical protein
MKVRGWLAFAVKALQHTKNRAHTKHKTLFAFPIAASFIMNKNGVNIGYYNYLSIFSFHPAFRRSTVRIKDSRGYVMRNTVGE